MTTKNTTELPGVETGTIAIPTSTSYPLDDPLILTTADYAVTKLVSLALTGEDNYHVWSRNIFTALEGRNKQVLVDGSLEARYAASNDTRVYELRQSMGETRQGAMSVTEYYTKQKGFWDEFIYYNILPDCTCGSRAALECYQQKDHTMVFLMGLNECFTIVCNQILSLEPLPVCSKALSMVLHIERQLTLTHTSSTPHSSSAMAAKSLSTNDSGKNASFGQGRRENLSCNYYRKSRHTIDKCYKLHGHPTG
ncbi:uncharacterized protein LOC120007322 [Tripterygium wilfordii]|uniref:uncharacterized protein LOC120007322 n=1 Tax=Tripterygium wilfordii TaxID=458696 RepID=UPI0018F82ACD|nr:uncharacterized protein LOC120007322 [Tripterygium wilfordii]